MCNLVSIRLEIVLVLVQDRCTVCAECTIGSKIVWTHPMELLGDVGLVESHFGPFGDIVGVGARSMHGLLHTYHWLTNHFGRSQWYS